MTRKLSETWLLNVFHPFGMVSRKNLRIAFANCFWVGYGMGERNRSRLEQFDDEAVTARLLQFPEDELARAMVRKNPVRRAKGVERALAISMAIFTGLRVKNSAASSGRPQYPPQWRAGLHPDFRRGG